MTAKDLATIESELNLVLPKHYREFMLNYPAAVSEARLDLGDEQRSPEESYFLNHANLVIEANKRVREPGLMMVNAETEPWPDKYFVIGNDGSGNLWCILKGNRSQSVWYFDHEEGWFGRQSKSLQEYTEYTLTFIEEFNAPEEDEED